MYKLLRLFIFVVIVAPSLLIVQSQSGNQLVIVSTSTHVTDLAHVITGDTAEVINIIGPGLNPHDYRFTERDATALGQADMVLYTGLGFEEFVESTLEDYERQKPVYGVLNVVREQGLGLKADPAGFWTNSHAWHDPRNWMLAAQGLADFLSEYDPSRADFYQANAEAYIEQLELLREWSLEAMTLVPEEERIIISSHGAFAYLGYAYGWELNSIQGINTSEEAGIGDIQEITNYVIENKIRAVFTESSLPADTIDAVVASARSQGWEVGIGGELLSDAFTERGTYTGSYIGMMHYNITTIVTAVGYGDEIPPFPEELPHPFANENEEEN